MQAAILAWEVHKNLLGDGAWNAFGLMNKDAMRDPGQEITQHEQSTGVVSQCANSLSSMVPCNPVVTSHMWLLNLEMPLV